MAKTTLYKNRPFCEQARLLDNALVIASKKLAMLNVLHQEIKSLQKNNQRADQHRLQTIAKRYAQKMIGAPSSNLQIIAEQIIKSYNIESPKGFFNFFRINNTCTNLNKGFDHALHHLHIDASGPELHTKHDVTKISQQALIDTSSKLPRYSAIQEHFAQVNLANKTNQALKNELERMKNESSAKQLTAKTIEEALTPIDIISTAVNTPQQLESILINTVNKAAPEAIDRITALMQSTHPARQNTTHKK